MLAAYAQETYSFWEIFSQILWIAIGFASFILSAAGWSICLEYIADDPLNVWSWLWFIFFGVSFLTVIAWGIWDINGGSL